MIRDSNLYMNHAEREVFPNQLSKVYPLFRLSRVVNFAILSKSIVGDNPDLKAASEATAGSCNRNFNLVLTRDNRTLLGQMVSTVSPKSVC
jgi:hypothetical protein